MNPVYSSFCLLVALAAVAASSPEQSNNLKKVGEEMNYINESLEDLIGQLTLIKQEATGRLSKYKSGFAPMSGSPDDLEKIRQMKVSKFILKRVSELESESLKMRDELTQLSKVQLKQLPRERRFVDPKQEDLDFEEPNSTQAPSTTTTTQRQQQQGMPATTTTTTTMKPEEEAAKIGFDIEALKKLGEEIGKRLDQFGKEAVKNLGDLIEGVKLVFREPTGNKSSNQTKPASPGAMRAPARP